MTTLIDITGQRFGPLTRRKTEMLQDANWDQWASLNDVIPLLAQKVSGNAGVDSTAHAKQHP